MLRKMSKTMKEYDALAGIQLAYSGVNGRNLYSKEAGFDLICLFGAHGFGIFQHFLSRATNHRTDEYGGSLENRSRFVNEVVDDIRDAVVIRWA